jgi:hypothetical protein
MMVEIMGSLNLMLAHTESNCQIMVNGTSEIYRPVIFRFVLG